MAARVIGDFFIDSCRCHPFGQYLVDIGFCRESGKDMQPVFRTVPFRQPTDGMAGKRQVNRCGGLLHHGRYPVLFSVQKDVLPTQGVDVTQPQTTVAGEKIGALHVLTGTLRVNQYLYLVNGQILASGFQCHDRIFRDNLGTDSGIERGGEITHIICRTLGRK